MKRIVLVLVAFCFVTVSFAQSNRKTSPTFTIKDSYGIQKEYIINEDFLQKFASWARNSIPPEYSVWYSDIYKAMAEGTSITYNCDTNQISGMYGKWHVKDKGLESGQSTLKKRIQAINNSTPHQFRRAMMFLGGFHVY